MARLVPHVSDFSLAGATDGERETLRLLKRRLPPALTVYHGVDWTRAYENRTAFGEIDFVVVNRAGRILAVEQKNGALIESGDGLYKSYGGQTKDIVRQLHRNLNGLRSKFRERMDEGLHLDYLLYCPDHRPRNLDAAGLDAERVVDATKRHRLAEIVQTLLEDDEGGDGRHAERVHRFFEQRFDIVPDINSYIDRQEQRFNRLNAELRQVVDNISMAALRLRVQGAAGCGKTGIAMHYYKRVVEAGRRPLLLCHNRPLREKLNALLPDAGIVQTRYGLTVKFLEDCGHPPNFEQRPGNPGFWTDLEDRLLEIGIPDEWKFDCLVVDEGQDFDDDALEKFRLFMRDDHDVLWLEDTDQNIRGADPFAASGFTTYRARRNCRSPESIARFIRAVLPSFDFEPGNDLPGLGVGVQGYDDANDQLRLAAAAVTQLRRQGFRPEDIAVVTMRGQDSSPLSGCNRLGGFAVRRFTGEYDRLGNQLMTEGEIYFDSIGRFKGQQAPAIVLCDVDPNPERADSLSRLYCGMTRATVRLELLANRAGPLYETLRRAGA